MRSPQKIFCPCLFMLLTLVARSGENKEKLTTPSTKPVVKTTKAARGPISVSVLVPGIIPYNAVGEKRIKASVAGKIDKILLGEGDIVQKGQPLFMIKGLLVKSRVKGTIIAQLYYEGQNVTSQTVIFTVIDLTSIIAVAEPNEIYLPYLKRGQKLEILTDAYPNKVFIGQCLGVSPIITATSRKVRAKIRIENPDSLLKPQMFLRVKIVKYFREDALLVPAKAVLYSGKQTVVFVRQGSRYRLRTVKTGAANSGKVEILKGLLPGEEVVVQGNYELLHKDFRGVVKQEVEEDELKEAR